MSKQPSEISYAGRIGMSHEIDIHGVEFFTNYSRPGNALAQFEGWIEKIVQEEVEKLQAEKLDLQQALRLATREIVHLKQIITNMEENP